MKMSSEAKLLLSLFLPFYSIYCVKQVYFMYGNVLQAYGFPPQTIGFLLGSLYLAVMAMRPVGGWLLERFGVRPALLAGSVVCFVGCMMLYFARSALLILAGRLLVGASISVYSMGVFAYQSLVVPERIRGAAFSLVVTGGMLPMATTTPVGEWLLLRGRVDAYLAIGPVFCLLCFFLGRRVVVEEGETNVRKEAWGSYRELLESRRFLLLVVSGFFISLADAAVVSMSVFAAERGVTVSYFMAASAVAAVIARVPCARILNALPRAKVLIPLGLTLPVALALVALFPSNATFLIGGLLSGAGIGFAWPILLALVSDILPARLRPKGTATTILFYDSCWFLTPMIVGYASRFFGMAGALVILAAISFVALSAIYVRLWIPTYREG